MKFFILIAIFILHKECHTHRFGYSRPEQRMWVRKHQACAGKFQSPIAISSNKAISLLMPAIEMVGYHNLLPAQMKIQNNGHSVSLHIDNKANNTLPYIFGGKLKNEYELVGLHFHWGDKNNRGAEHVLNDIRYPMEMHIIHRNRKYKDLAEALGHGDGLTVLGFFYQINEIEGDELSSFVKNLGTISDFNNEVQLNHTFTLTSLIGNIDLDRFYTYKGSLTTPPCSEAVTWVLFPDPLSVSVGQMNKFRQLLNGVDSVLVDNYRALQPLGNRNIFVRKINPKYMKITSHLNEYHHSKWDWTN